jgi:hypothetical protein
MSPSGEEKEQQSEAQAPDKWVGEEVGGFFHGRGFLGSCCLPKEGQPMQELNTVCLNFSPFSRSRLPMSQFHSNPKITR